MSHNCFVYLDDGISGHHDYVSARAASLIQRSDLASSGFIPRVNHNGSLFRLGNGWDSSLTLFNSCFKYQKPSWLS